MVSNVSIIEVIAEKLHEYRATRVVLDPVMISTSGSKLLCDDAQTALRTRLMPCASLITPNIPEAEVLSSLPIRSRKDMERAAQIIAAQSSCAVLVKGGHRVSDAADVLYNDGTVCWFESERIDNPNTHGTGCTLSSAIACNLAVGYPLEEGIRRAKAYLTGALRAMLDLGQGSGPLDHMYGI